MWWRLKSPASRLFTQRFVQAQIKENINAPRHWSLWGEITGEFPAQRTSNAENVPVWWRHHACIDEQCILWDGIDVQGPSFTESPAWISNYIPQKTMRYDYLSTPWSQTSDNTCQKRSPSVCSMVCIFHIFCYMLKFRRTKTLICLGNRVAIWRNCCHWLQQNL